LDYAPSQTVEALVIRPRIGTVGDQKYPDEDDDVVAEDGAEVRADDMD
jgi:hypothetical protein